MSKNDVPSLSTFIVALILLAIIIFFVLPSIAQYQIEQRKLQQKDTTFKTDSIK